MTSVTLRSRVFRAEVGDVVKGLHTDREQLESGRLLIPGDCLWFNVVFSTLLYVCTVRKIRKMIHNLATFSELRFKNVSSIVHNLFSHVSVMLSGVLV